MQNASNDSEEQAYNAHACPNQAENQAAQRAINAYANQIARRHKRESVNASSCKDEAYQSAECPPIQQNNSNEAAADPDAKVPARG